METWRARFCLKVAFSLILIVQISIATSEQRVRGYTHWTADIPGGYYEARNVARRHGITLRGHVVLGKSGHQLYRLSASGLDQPATREISENLWKDPKVNWVALQIELDRERKSVLPFWRDRDSNDEITNEEDDEILSRVKRHHTDVNCVCKNVSSYPDETFGSHVYKVMDRQSDPSLARMFNDPKWPCQWELYNCGQTTGPHRVDLNVVPCWEKGFTGKGIVVTIVDDGLDYINEDLKEAYDQRASADLNGGNGYDGPLPDKSKFGNDHGTKCGGEVAMRPNNNYCGVGVAYDASLGGIRFLDGVVTDTSEAAALVFNADYIDIYSCSWGPQDNGKSWEGPGRLASAALQVGSTEGRGGLGSIYVWAGGNGGAADDHCGADGYTCSIYTIGIASVSDQGLSTFYTESCSCIMAVTLNGGAHEFPSMEKQYKPLHYLVTTDPYEGCVNTFSGTSSAAPLASGVLALVLQANPKLTWRDVQHLVVMYSKIPNPTEDGWHVNGAGFHVHHKYGFGLLDAAKLVMEAQSWKNVEPQQKCEVRFPDANRYVKAGGSVTFKGHTMACSDSENRVQELEHVQVIMTYYPKCRGDVSIELISPCGTRSELMGTRMFDKSKDAVEKWPFMTVYNWGEDPRGVWKVKVSDNKGAAKGCSRGPNEDSGVRVKEIHLVFWGTSGKQGNKVGCEEKERIAEDVEEEENSNYEQTALNIDPKNPQTAEERIDQEIINAEFVGEHGTDITADDLQKAKRGHYFVNDNKAESAKEDISNLREKLIEFLKSRSDNDGPQFLRDGIPLSRSARRRGD